MGILLIVLLAISVVATLIGWIWLIVLAFQNGEKLWGTLMVVGVIVPFVGPIASLVFVIQNWQIARRAAKVYLGGIVVGVIAGVAAAGSMANGVAGEVESARMKAAMAAAGKQDANSNDAPAIPLPAAPEIAPPAEPIAPKPVIRATPQPRPVDSEPKARPSPPAPERDSRVSPIRVSLVELGAAGANQLRTLRVRIANDENLAVKEVKLDLSYFDSTGLRIGGWKTIHSDTSPLAPPKGTNEFEITAFFVPQFTTDVHLGVEAVRFTDGTRWPERP